MDPKNVERAIIYTLIITLSAALIAGAVALVIHFSSDGTADADGVVSTTDTTGEESPDTDSVPPESTAPGTDHVTEAAPPDTDNSAGSDTGDGTDSVTAAVTVTNYSEPKIMYATSNANARASWDTKSIILGIIYQSEPVTVTGETDNGWYVVDFRGYTAYIFAELLTEDSSVTEVTVKVYSSPRTMYAAQNVNVRESHSTNSAIFEQITAGTEVTVIGETDNNWYQISYNDGVAYIRTGYLTLTKPTIEPVDSEEREA